MTKLTFLPQYFHGMTDPPPDVFVQDVVVDVHSAE